MKKFFVSVLAFLVVVASVAGAIAGVYLYRKYAPSKARVDMAEWFGVSGDSVALVLDQELDLDDVGQMIDGQLYLPLNWVNECLNEKFYWDAAGEQMIYTLPDSIIYADTKTLGSTGKPLVVKQDDLVWLNSGLISTYTDVRMELFDQDMVKRVFIDTKWDPQQAAVAKKDTQIRNGSDVKSAVIADVAKGSEVTVLDSTGDWLRVRTGDGYLGYVQHKVLRDFVEQTMISTFEAPVYSNISLDEPVVLAWHQVTKSEANKSMEEFVANTKGLNVIAPTWFMLTDNSGNYNSLASRDYVDKAHALGLQVWPTVDNFNQGENVKSEILFADTTARAKLIERLMADVKKYDLDGLNLDIEMIKPQAGPHYVQFIRELSVSCRRDGVILSVDNALPVATSQFYNRAEQGRVVDYVVIMGYDEHTSVEGMSSSASYSFVKQGIEDTLAVVPKEKVINAIPVYTRRWKTDAAGETSSTALGMVAAQKWVQENGVQLYWQEELGQFYGELKAGNEEFYIWMEEQDSVKKKMELIYENELAGVAVWKLGLEPAQIWDVILDGLEGKTDA